MAALSGLESHPQHDLASANDRFRQSGRFEVKGGEVKGGEVKAARSKAARSRRQGSRLRGTEPPQAILISNNLGDSKSLITHPGTTTHAKVPEEDKLRVASSRDHPAVGRAGGYRRSDRRSQRGAG